MCDTRNNVGVTWSNGKSPKFWARSSQSSNWNKSAIKAIWFKILLRNVITTKGHRKEDLMVGWKITSRCIAFGSPVASSYAQSNNITSEQENPITTSIRSWLRVAVSKLKSDIVLSEIRLRVKYQKGRGHPHLFNGYLLAFIRSMIHVLWLFARWRVCWKLQFRTDYNAERKINSGAVRMGFFPWVEYQKNWITLPAFHWLLIQPHQTTGLEDTEFCVLAKLLKTELLR
jgi:hypothetical protein